MSEPATKPPTQYYSRYEQRVDEKRRVQIPAKWRSEEEIILTMVVWQQHRVGACIRVLPPHEHAKNLATIEAMPPSEKKVYLKRSIGAESDQVTWDKAGRIVVPDYMAKAAGIEKDVLLAGAIDCFEIWNPERYENVKAVDVSVANEAFTLL